MRCGVILLAVACTSIGQGKTLSEAIREIGADFAKALNARPANLQTGAAFSDELRRAGVRFSSSGAPLWVERSRNVQGPVLTGKLQLEDRTVLAAVAFTDANNEPALLALQPVLTRRDPLLDVVKTKDGWLLLETGRVLAFSSLSQPPTGSWSLPKRSLERRPSGHLHIDGDQITAWVNGVGYRAQMGAPFAGIAETESKADAATFQARQISDETVAVSTPGARPLTLPGILINLVNRPNEALVVLRRPQGQEPEPEVYEAWIVLRPGNP